MGTTPPETGRMDTNRLKLGTNRLSTASPLYQFGSVIIYGRFSLHQMFQFDSGFSMTNGRVILSCLGKVSYENTKLYKRKENKPYSLPFLTFFTCFGVARRL